VRTDQTCPRQARFVKTSMCQIGAVKINTLKTRSHEMR